MGLSKFLGGSLLTAKASQCIERVLAFSFISNKYLLTVHQDHLSVYDLSKEYLPSNRLDPLTEPVPVCQFALPGIFHAAGLHRSRPLDHVPGSPFVLPPPDAANVLPMSRPTSDEDTLSDSDDERTPWEDKEVPFYEDPNRNILAVNLIRHVGYGIAGTTGTTIIIPLQRLVDFVEETTAKSAVDVTGKAAGHTNIQAKARDTAEAQMYSELDIDQPPGITHCDQIFELAQLEQQKRIGLIREGVSAATTRVHGSSARRPRKPRRVQPSRWLKQALVFNQETHGRLCDYRRSAVSGSRFVSSVEVKEGIGLFQLIEFNPTWVNALEKWLGRPARKVGVHHETVERWHPTARLMERDWETEGLIVPMTFEEHVAVTDHPGDSDDLPDIRSGPYGELHTFPPPHSSVTPAPTPILSPSLVEVGSPEPSWHGWRVARCGEVKYAWKIMEIDGGIIALDVAIQEDSLIYTAVSVLRAFSKRHYIDEKGFYWTGRRLFYGSACIL